MAGVYADRVMRLAAVLWAIALGIAAMMVVNPLLSTSDVDSADEALDLALWSYIGLWFLLFSLPALAGARLLRSTTQTYARWLAGATIAASALALILFARVMHDAVDAVGVASDPFADPTGLDGAQEGTGIAKWAAVTASLAIAGGIASVGVRALHWQRWLGIGVVMMDVIAAACWIGLILGAADGPAVVLQTLRVALICSALSLAGVLAVNALEALDAAHLRAARAASHPRPIVFGARPGTTVATQIAQAAQGAPGGDGPMSMGAAADGVGAQGATPFAPAPEDMCNAQLADALILAVRTWRGGLRARIVADSAQGEEPGEPSQQEAEELRSQIAAARAEVVALNIELPDRVSQATVGLIAALGQLVHARPADLVETAPAVDAALRVFIDDPDRRDWVARHRTPPGTTAPGTS